ncbi:hypothetical protein PNOK_0663900 [Pyrrhoderma noxium]|uniref:CFEM domain-containing protein n=1 Tax=Pyrrhoderma noxium TaxID=2282107 RepID=A0A286UEX5_9AGAM|nr:hypothetical protein PNOK_0663900 [Pyrrhoderma noxium]
MRFTFALLLAGAASASLVSRQDIPTCALTCIASADTGSCSQTDTSCLCNDQSFVSSTTTCIETSCSSDDVAAAEAFAQQTCESVGVTLTASSAASTGSATGSTSGSSAASTASSTTTSAGATTTSNAAQSNRVPVLAAAALGLAAFAL